MLAPKEQFQVSCRRCTQTQAEFSGEATVPRLDTWTLLLSEADWWVYQNSFGSSHSQRRQRQRRQSPPWTGWCLSHGLGKWRSSFKVSGDVPLYKDSKGSNAFISKKDFRGLLQSSLCKTKTSGKKTVSNKKIGTKHLKSLVPSLSTSPNILKSAL